MVFIPTVTFKKYEKVLCVCLGDGVKCAICVCTFLKLLNVKSIKVKNCPGFPYYTLLEFNIIVMKMELSIIMEHRIYQTYPISTKKVPSQLKEFSFKVISKLASESVFLLNTESHFPTKVWS